MRLKMLIYLMLDGRGMGGRKKLVNIPTNTFISKKRKKYKYYSPCFCN